MLKIDIHLYVWKIPQLLLKCKNMGITFLQENVNIVQKKFAYLC